jgi:hypothetical protein
MTFGLMRDAAALLHDVEALATGFSDLVPKVAAVGRDVTLVYVTHSRAAGAQLLADLKAAWDAARADYPASREAVAKFVADAEKLVADLRS